jgi:HD-GYP domain-containing protein (c-di-GMP phosphodiesterase class II)
MAEHTEVMTGDAIYTDKGMKLVDKGTRVDSRLYDRLVMHKLRDPIDANLITGDLVDVASLVALARQQCERSRSAASHGGVHRRCRASAGTVKSLLLPQAIAFKLTVMRRQRSRLYQHSLQMTLVAIFLALKNGWTERECVPLATAALLHDVGMLYGPGLDRPGPPLERRGTQASGRAFRHRHAGGAQHRTVFARRGNRRARAP